MKPTQEVKDMKKLSNYVLFIFLPTIINAEVVENSILGITIGESTEIAFSLLTEHCESPFKKEVSPVSFPIAVHNEAYLVCDELSNGGEIAITVADGKVAHIYGIKIPDELVIEPKGQTSEYMGHQAYEGYVLWKYQPDNSVILVHEDGLHPHLFLWKNPMLKSVNNTNLSNTHVSSSVLKLGSDFKDLKPIFDQSCAPLEVKPKNSPWFTNPSTNQFQVDCFHHNIFGFQRKIEAVFSDELLKLVWILTAKQEEDRLKEHLVRMFGPVHKTYQNWFVFDQGRIYLRKDKPEILIISDELAPAVREKYNLDAP